MTEHLHESQRKVPAATGLASRQKSFCNTGGIPCNPVSIASWRPSSNASTKTGAASLPPLPPSWARPDEATLPLQRVCDSLLLDAEISERDTVCQAMVGSKLKLMINKRAFEFVLRFCFVCILSASWLPCVTLKCCFSSKCPLSTTERWRWKRILISRAMPQEDGCKIGNAPDGSSLGTDGAGIRHKFEDSMSNEQFLNVLMRHNRLSNMAAGLQMGPMLQRQRVDRTRPV